MTASHCPNCQHDGKPIGNMGMIACENIDCRVSIFHGTYHTQIQTDGDFLRWIADRLVKVHKEHPGQDFILKLSAIASKLS